ncbi:MAG: ribosome biogenesis GTPase Der [Opitutales bacterium]
MITFENRTVAIVGRPNVGKSRLFNRLVGKRLAIVHDQPGVTRDVTMAEVKDGQFMLLDTGGIGLQPELTPEVIHCATEEQVSFALDAATLVLFVCEGPTGPTAVDAELAERLRAMGKPTLLVCNKMESRPPEMLAEFYAFGLGEPLSVSAEHNEGIAALLDAIEAELGPPPLPDAEVPEAEAPRTRLVFCGRPNVGKSSLGNALLKQARLIVSEVAGTTRDSVEHDLDWEGPNPEEPPARIRLIDTAGLKANRKLASSLDYFSGLRSRAAIESADIACLLLDAREGVTKLDKKLAGEILETGAALIIVVNKWDYAVQAFQQEEIQQYKNVTEFRKAFIKAVNEELFFLPNSPIVFLSATERLHLDILRQEIVRLGKRLDQTLPTGPVNRVIHNLLERQPPRLSGGRRFKIYYAVQIGIKPLRLKLFCNRKENLDDSYKRYLQSGIHKEFDLAGCPVHFVVSGKQGENPYHTPSPAPRKNPNTLSKHGKAAKKAVKRARRR